MNTEQQYVKGFNTGYLLTKYEPELLPGMVKSLPSTADFFQGFFAGKDEIERENIKLQLNEIQLLRNNEQNLERKI